VAIVVCPVLLPLTAGMADEQDAFRVRTSRWLDAVLA
jgi:hypothetical protein